MITNKVLSKLEANFESEITFAFKLGLLWGHGPSWFIDQLQLNRFAWEGPKASIKFSFISETADSWHAAYRELREAGWTRYYADRQGGLITYGLRFTNTEWPPGYQDIDVQFCVSLPTCRQVKTGTREVDVFETVCDDIQEPDETIPETSPPDESSEAFSVAAEEEYSSGG